MIKACLLVMNHDAGVYRRVGSLKAVDAAAGMLKCLVDSLEQEPNLGVHTTGLGRADAKELRIELAVHTILREEV